MSSEGPRPWMVSGSAAMPDHGSSAMPMHPPPMGSDGADMIMGYDPGSSLGAPL